MSLNYHPELSKLSTDYADRYSRGRYMQAAILNKVVYPTGGYTTYEYEPNAIRVNTIEETQKFLTNAYSKYEASFCFSKRPF